MKRFFPFLILVASIVSAVAQPVLPRESDTVHFITTGGMTNLFTWTGTNFFCTTNGSKMFRTNTTIYRLVQTNGTVLSNVISFATRWYNESGGAIGGTSRWVGVSTPAPPTTNPNASAGAISVNSAGRVISPANFFTANQIPGGLNFMVGVGGDWHSGFVGLGGAPGSTVDGGRNAITNAVTALIAFKATHNLNRFYLYGDLADSGGGAGLESHMGTNMVFVTNQLWRLQNAGITVPACFGNHEGQLWTGTGSDTNVDKYYGPLFEAQRPYFQGTNTWGGYRQAYWTFTNGMVKDLVVSADLYATGRTAWVKSRADLFPDHRLIILTHHGLGSHGNRLRQLDTSNEGLQQSILEDITNLREFRSGHQRDAFAWSYLISTLESGARPVEMFWNCQQLTNAGGDMLQLFDYRPGENRCVVSVYDTSTSSYLTNGQPAKIGSLSSNGYYANWEFKIWDSSEGNRQYLGVEGIRQQRQGNYSGVGNWSGTFSIMELDDSSFAFRQWLSGATYPNAWVIKRRWADSTLWFGWMGEDMFDSPSVSTNLASLDTNGVFMANSLLGANRTAPINTRVSAGTNLWGLDYATAGGGSLRLYSKSTFRVFLDADADSTSVFAIRGNTNATSTDAFSVSEAGVVQGSTNAISDWPTAATAAGNWAIVSSNGTVYILSSSPGSTAWTGTNKISQ